MIDLDKLLELEARVDCAPWKQVGSEIVNHCDNRVCSCGGWVPGNRLSNHAEFIVEARNALKELCLRLKEAEATLIWYGDKQNYYEYGELIDGIKGYSFPDKGARARELLDKWRGEK